MRNPPTQSQTVAALYMKYGATAYAHCRRMLKDEAQAEDAAQEVFLRIVRHLASMPPEAQVLAWIRRIATNYCLNVIRGRGYREQLECELSALPSGMEEPDAAQKDLVDRLLAITPEKERAPAVLHYLHDVPQERVGRALGISRRTVINRLDQFKRRSRTRLQREGLEAVFA